MWEQLIQEAGWSLFLGKSERLLGGLLSLVVAAVLEVTTDALGLSLLLPTLDSPCPWDLPLRSQGPWRLCPSHTVAAALALFSHDSAEKY